MLRSVRDEAEGKARGGWGPSPGRGDSGLEPGGGDAQGGGVVGQGCGDDGHGGVAVTHGGGVLGQGATL